jgi:hypothetical protein
MAELDVPLVRILVRLALCLCCLSAAAACWEFLALQMPDSPFHFGVLSGPIAQLRNFSAALGLGALALAPVWPRLYPAGEGRLVLGLLLLASCVLLAALSYAAAQGMVGAQLLDPRFDARALAYARAFGHGLLTLALVLLSVRALRRVA